MRLKTLYESARILPWSDEYGLDDGDDYDPYVAADQADKIADLSGIRIDSTKELTYIAMEGDQVIGGLWAALMNDDDAMVYSWDVAVHPEFRNARTGLELIDAAMEDYRMHSMDHEKIYMRVWAVNPKLARVLERKYGFDVESDHGEGGMMMTYYGQSLTESDYDGLPDEDEFSSAMTTDCANCGKSDFVFDDFGRRLFMNCGLCGWWWCRECLGIDEYEDFNNETFSCPETECVDHGPGRARRKYTRPACGTIAESDYDGLPDEDEFSVVNQLAFECAVCQSYEPETMCLSCRRPICANCMKFNGQNDEFCPECFIKYRARLAESDYDDLPDEDTFEDPNPLCHCANCGKVSFEFDDYGRQLLALCNKCEQNWCRACLGIDALSPCNDIDKCPECVDEYRTTRRRRTRLTESDYDGLPDEDTFKNYLLCHCANCGKVSFEFDDYGRQLLALCNKCEQNWCRACLGIDAQSPCHDIDRCPKCVDEYRATHRQGYWTMGIEPRRTRLTESDYHDLPDEDTFRNEECCGVCDMLVLGPDIRRCMTCNVALCWTHAWEQIDGIYCPVCVKKR